MSLIPGPSSVLSDGSPISVSRFRLEQSSGWTVSMVGKKMRLEYAGGSVVDWGYSGGQISTGLILVGGEVTGGVPYDSSSLTHVLASHIQHDHPTVDGISAGIGFINASTFAAATKWGFIRNERDGSTTVKVIDFSHAQQVLALSLSDARSASILIGLGPSRYYSSHSSTKSQLRTTTRWNTFIDYTGERLWRCIVAGSSSGAAGYVDVLKAVGISKEMGLL